MHTRNGKSKHSTKKHPTSRTMRAHSHDTAYKHTHNILYTPIHTQVNQQRKTMIQQTKMYRKLELQLPSDVLASTVFRTLSYEQLRERTPDKVGWLRKQSVKSSGTHPSLCGDDSNNQGHSLQRECLYRRSYHS